MAEGMICEQMSSLGNAAGKLRLRGDEFPDQKKTCLDVMTSQDIQQSLGAKIVRAIVISERQLSRI